MFLDLFSNRRTTNSRSSSASKSRRNPTRRRLLTCELLEKRAMLSVSTFPAHQVLDPNIGILTLDSSSYFASLTRSGNGSITVKNGDIVVDSSSSGAGYISGAGNVSANNIYVHGGIQTTGTGRFLGNVFTGSPTMADPLAALPAPAQPPTVSTASNISNTTVTLNPGTYSASNILIYNSHVKLNPGLYYFLGNLTVTNSTVTGTGVTIYNKGYLNIGGSSNVTLSAPTTGTYQGIVIFQSRTDSQTLTISGNATATLTGEVYAADAQLNLSGNGNRWVNGDGGPEVINGAVIVKDLNASGDGSLTVATNASGFGGTLSITKTDNVGGSSITNSQGSATAGGTIVYTITVGNAGPSSAFGATVADVFPAFITSDTYTVATTGGASDVTHPASGSGAIADTVNLPSGSTITYTFTAHISGSATGSMTNTASVTPPPNFTPATNKSASDTDNFLAANLAITKTDNKGGSSITRLPAP